MPQGHIATARPALTLSPRAPWPNRTLALRASPGPSSSSSPVPGSRASPSLLRPLRPLVTVLSLQPRALLISHATSVETPMLPPMSDPLFGEVGGSGAAIAAVSGGRLIRALVRQPRDVLSTAGPLSVGYGTGDGSSGMSVLVRSQGVVLPLMVTVREVKCVDGDLAGGSGGWGSAGAEGSGGGSNSSVIGSTGWIEARSGAVASTAVVRDGNGDGEMVSYEYDIELLAPPPGPGVALVGSWSACRIGPNSSAVVPATSYCSRGARARRAAALAGLLDLWS